jgi:UDP-N-acetylmuramate dehydrogenase
MRGDVTASRATIDERLHIRHANHPHEPSAGCVFKNVEFEKVDLADLAKRGIDITKFEKFKKIPTGYLIEQLGLKGKTIGGAMISPQHANYIVNTGTATFEDVIMLISYIKQQVRDAYGIQLEEEAHIVA